MEMYLRRWIYQNDSIRCLHSIVWIIYRDEALLYRCAFILLSLVFIQIFTTNAGITYFCIIQRVFLKMNYFSDECELPAVTGPCRATIKRFFLQFPDRSMWRIQLWWLLWKWKQLWNYWRVSRNLWWLKTS